MTDLARIHVNRTNIVRNKDNPDLRLPVYMVTMPGKTKAWRAYEVVIHGPSQLVYRQDDPHLGAVAYIEARPEHINASWAEPEK